MNLHKISYLFIIISLLAFIGCAQFMGSDSCPIGYNKAAAGNCVQDFSCLEKETCIANGKCTYAPKDMCVATRTIDCQSSTNCAKLGECGFELKNHKQGPVGLCVASTDGCARSEVCAEFGKCTPGNKGFCIVGGDEDCAGSALCKDKGRCTAMRVQTTDGRRSKVASCQM